MSLLESDQFHALLTDALRAGPASPEWNRAVATLRESGPSAQADEYRLLVAAREHLESGKGYRSVRPGPAFSRKVMQAIDQDAESTLNDGDDAKRRRPSTATMIALASAALVAIAIGALIIWIASRPPVPAPPDSADGGVEALARTVLVTTGAPCDFSQAIIPAGWDLTGSLPLEFKGGLRPVARRATTTSNPTTNTTIGGLQYVNEFPAGAPFAIEATLRINRPGEQAIPQIVVATSIAKSIPDDAPPTSPGAGAYGHHPSDEEIATPELVCLLKGRQVAVVLPDGRLAVQMQPPSLAGTSNNPTTIKIRVTVGPTVAIVEVDGKRAWAGPHQLAPDAARTAALQFIRRGDVKGTPDAVVFTSVSVMTK